jgi:uncharacterized protein (DUF433 family)
VPLITTTSDGALAADLDLYGGRDPRHVPHYTKAATARATDVPASTIRAWVKGQHYTWGADEEGFFEPLIQLPDPEDGRLSFVNLVEVHMLRAIRTVHGIPMQRVRRAIRIAEDELGIDRLLISPQLKTDDRDLFLDRYSTILKLSPSRQLAMKTMIEEYLTRIEWEESGDPLWYFPFSRSPRNQGKKVVAVNPFVSFGRAVIRSSGVSTKAINQRIDAGEAPEIVAADYGISDAEIEEAILYENAA